MSVYSNYLKVIFIELTVKYSWRDICILYGRKSVTLLKITFPD